MLLLFIQSLIIVKIICFPWQSKLLQTFYSDSNLSKVYYCLIVQYIFNYLLLRKRSTDLIFITSLLFFIHLNLANGYLFDVCYVEHVTVYLPDTPNGSVSSNIFSLEEDRLVPRALRHCGSYWPPAVEGSGDASVNAKRSNRRCHGEAVYEKTIRNREKPALVSISTKRQSA